MTQDATVISQSIGCGSSARLAFLAIAVTSLGLAVQDSGGNLSPTAILWLTLSLASGWGGLWAGSESRGRWPWAVTGLCVLTQFAVLAVDPLIGSMSMGAFKGYAATVAVAAVLAGALCAASAKSRPWIFLLLAGVAAFLGCWLLRKLPIPGIDVLMFQEQSWQALLHGVNPYTIHFADPYPPASSALFYGLGVSVNGVLQFGYPYMPLTLLMALPGYLLGDVRYASLAAMILSAILIAFARPSRGSFLAATLLLFTPAFPLMLYLGWTESYVLLLVAAAWFCQCRSPRLVPYVIGLLLVSKQYMIIGAPVALVLLPRPLSARALWSFVWRASLAGAAVTLPLVAWNPQAFLHSAVWLQFRQPFRWDALSYLVWAEPKNPAKWMGLPFAGAAIAWLAVLAAGRRRKVPFALALALTMAAFFALNKQAFANYYYLVIGTFCVAAAGVGEEMRRASLGRWRGEPAE